MSTEIPGITATLHDVAIKPSELAISLRKLETGIDGKNNFADALELFEHYKAALYGARITLTALKEMGIIGPNFDTDGFQKEVDRIRMKLGLPIEPSILNGDSPIYVIEPKEDL